MLFMFLKYSLLAKAFEHAILEYWHIPSTESALPALSLLMPQLTVTYTAIQKFYHTLY